MWSNTLSPTLEFGFGNIGSFRSMTSSPRPITRYHSMGRVHSMVIDGSKIAETPPAQVKKTLVLDLDETLIHSSDFPPHSQVQFFKSGDPEFYVHKRPGLDQFLEFVRDNFETFIFTFGDQTYAEPVLNVLCPFIDNEHRFYRDSCETKAGTVKKDIGIFNRDKKSMILIDDSSSATTHNPKNTIKIPRWKGSPQDDALINWLPPILQECLNSDDVRKVIRKTQEQQKLDKRKRSNSVKIFL